MSPTGLSANTNPERGKTRVIIAGYPASRLSIATPRGAQRCLIWLHTTCGSASVVYKAKWLPERGGSHGNRSEPLGF